MPGTYRVVLSGIFVLLVSASAILGLTGLAQMSADAEPPNWSEFVTAFLGLYSNQTRPWTDAVKSPPLCYDIARVLAPVSTAYVLATSVAHIFSERRRVLRARLARNHSIVVGGGRRGVLLSRSLAQRGATVVLVDVAAATERFAAALLKHTIPLSGDPVDDIVLRRAGIDRGKELFAVSDDSELNASVVISARRLRRRTEPFTCYALINDSDMHAAFEARLLSMPHATGFQVSLIDRNQLIARGLSEASGAEAAETVMVLGDGGLVRALALEAIRSREGSSAADRSEPAPAMRVIVAGPQGDSVVDEILGSRAESALPTVLRSATNDLAAFTEGSTLRDLIRPAARARVFVCAQRDEDSLRLAFAVLKQAKDIATDVVVCVETASGFAGAFAADGVRIFDDAKGAIRIIASSEFVGDAARIRDAATTERLARAIHATYRRHMSGRPTVSRDSRHVVQWAELPEAARESNRAQARHLGEKLRLLGCAIMPSTPGGDVQLSEGDFEQLARAEHDRWTEEARGRGLVHGPERSDRTHPDLVPWEQLTEDAREKDRIFMRELPLILAREGYAIVRFPHHRLAAPTNATAADVGPRAP